MAQAPLKKVELAVRTASVWNATQAVNGARAQVNKLQDAQSNKKPNGDFEFTFVADVFMGNTGQLIRVFADIAKLPSNQNGYEMLESHWHSADNPDGACAFIISDFQHLIERVESVEESDTVKAEVI